MVWDNEECDGGAEPCSGIWSWAQHVQKHVENVYRLNRPWSLSSGRFAGIAGHVITSAYDGCAVKMRMIKCTVWVYNVPVCAHACIWSYVFVHHNVILCAHVKLMDFRSKECVCAYFISSPQTTPILSDSRFFSSFLCCMDVRRVQNRQRKRRLAERKKKRKKKTPGHTEIPSRWGRGNKGSWMFPGAKTDRMTRLRACQLTSCCYNIL